MQDTRPVGYEELDGKVMLPGLNNNGTIPQLDRRSDHTIAIVQTLT